MAVQVPDWPVVVPDEDEVGQFGDPQLHGQQPRPAGGQPGDSDAARLDLERLEAGGLWRNVRVMY